LFLAVRRLGWGVSVLASPLFTFSIMIFILGFQLIMMGLLAEMLTRSYYESQGKRTYTVKKLINFKSDK